MPGNRVAIQTLIPFLAESTGREDLSDKIDLLAEFALEAERKIGTRAWLDEVKPVNGLPVAIIPIVNYRGLLPNDYYDCDDIEYCSSNLICGCQTDQCNCACDCGCNASNIWNVACSCGAWNSFYMPRQPQVRIEGCYVKAPYRRGSVRMHYFAIPLADDGYPFILQSHRDAILSYCLWQLNVANWIQKKIPASTIQMLENRWKELCSIARGNDNLPDRQEITAAAQVTNDPWKTKRNWGWGANGWGNGNGWGW